MRTLQVRLLFGLWLGLLWLTTVARADVWQTALSLYADGVTKAPTKPRMLVDYGEMLEESGDLRGALMMFERSYTAVGWRKDRRSRVSKFYTVQDLVHNLILQGREVNLWPVLKAAGCPFVVTTNAINGKLKITWTCPVDQW